MKHVDANLWLWQIISNFLVQSVNGSVIATLVAGGIGALAVWFTAKRSTDMLKKQFALNKLQHEEQFGQSEKQHQAHGLLMAFGLLDSPRHRTSRKRIYELYFEFLKEENIEVFSQREAGDIMADFDVIGKLVENNNISIDDFLNVYGSLAYRCWKILELHIIKERENRGLDKFMSNFQTLALDGYIYWDQVENFDIDNTILYNPNPNDTKKRITFKEIKNITNEFISRTSK